MTDDSSREISIFVAAIEKQSPEKLAAYLDETCGDNQQLRAHVEALVATHRKGDSFLEHPAPGFDRTVDLSRDVLEAGLSATFGTEAAVVIGDTGHSVLKSLSKQLPKTPRVVLREAEGESGKAVQPGSTEVPTAQEDIRYQLHGEIARGGMGAIIRGRDTDLGRDLAIKVLLDSHKDKPEVLQRFVEEAQIGGQLQHPGIVPIYELGQFGDSRPFFTMKLVKGATLAALLAKRTDPSDELPKLIGIFEQICQAMAYTHSKGVIHRDLKPANIMVGAFGEVQVMDWGLAKVLGVGGVDDEKRSLDQHRDVSVIQTRRSSGSDSPSDVGSQTQMGSVMGTLAYMPPEQALGEIDRLDERADVFGLGAVLTEILTGKPPYVADDGTQVFRMASRGRLDDCFVRLDDSGAEPELIEIAKTALSPEPGDRMRDAGELSAGITQHLEGVQERLKQTELARVEAQTRTEEERRRRKLYLTIAGMLLLLAVGAAAAFSQVARTEKLRADQETKHALDQQQARENADKSRELALAEARRANAMRLAALARSILDDQPVTGTLLAIEAVESFQRSDGAVLPVAHETLLTATHNVGGRLLAADNSRMEAVLITPDGRRIVTISGDAVRLKDFTSASIMELAVPEGGGRGARAVISANSRWLAMSSGDIEPSVWLWDLDATDPRQPALELKGHKRSIASIAISPNSRWLVTGSWDGAARLWDLTADNPSAVQRELRHNDSVQAVAVGPASRWLATGSLDGSTRLWDLTSDHPEDSAILLNGDHKKAVVRLVFSENGRWLASGSWDRTARLWDLTERNQAGMVLPGLEADAGAVAISPNGRWLVTGRRLWDLTAENPASSPLILMGHEGFFPAVAISPNNRWLIVGSRDHRVRLWNLTLEDPTAMQFELRAHQEAVLGLAVSPDSRWLITGSWDGTARVWDLEAENPATPLVLTNEGSPCVSREGNRLATQSSGGRVRVWNLDTTRQNPVTLECSFTNIVPTVPDRSQTVDLSQRQIVAASEDGKARVWDLSDAGAPPRVFGGKEGPVVSVLLSRNERWLVAGDNGKTALLWDLNDSMPSFRRLPGYRVNKGTAYTPIAVSADGRWVATADGETLEQSVRLWDLSAADPTASPKDLPQTASVFESSSGGKLGNGIPLLKFSPNSQWLVAQHADGTVRLWNVTSGNAEQRWLVLSGHEQFVFRIGFTQDCRRLVTASWDGTARMWDLDADDPASSFVRLGSKTAALYCASVSPDGRWVVTAGEDKTVRVWDLHAEDLEASKRTLRGDRGMINQIAFSSDSRWVISGSTDRTVRFWDLDVDTLIRRARELVGPKLTAEEQQEYGIGTPETP